MKEDILLLIEPINHFDIPGFHLTGTQQALKLIEDVGCCNVKSSMTFIICNGWKVN